MSDPKLIREVTARLREQYEQEQDPASGDGPVGEIDDGRTKGGECRTAGCTYQPNGLDGFCRRCSRERERACKWFTPELRQQIDRRREQQ